MDSASTDQVRRFNRTVTERVGALNDQYLGRDHPLGEARLLWEIGPEGAAIRDLRGRLGLDSGYLSRLLRSLERKSFVTVEESVLDRRVRQVRLTPEGAAERSELDRLSNQLAIGILEPLTAGQQARLIEAMAEVERLLTASLVEVVPEDPTSADARWCIDQYFAELAERFEGGFDSSVTTRVDPAELTPPKGLLLLARLRGAAVGCGGLRFHGDDPVELKRMWVARSARGLGVGRRLLTELEGRARFHGATVLHLETNRALAEAIRLYRRNGFVEVAPFNQEPYAHHWFEKRLETEAKG